MARKTGLALRQKIRTGVVIQLLAAMITTSPGPILSAAVPMRSAPAQLDEMIACRTPNCASTNALKRAVYS